MKHLASCLVLASLLSAPLTSAADLLSQDEALDHWRFQSDIDFRSSLGRQQWKAMHLHTRQAMSLQVDQDADGQIDWMVSQESGPDQWWPQASSLLEFDEWLSYQGPYGRFPSRTMIFEWLKGQPLNSDARVRHDPVTQLPTTIRESGWLVRYSPEHWATMNDGMAPVRIEIYGFGLRIRIQHQAIAVSRGPFPPTTAPQGCPAPSGA
jgi:hypothetical protein